MKNAARNWLRLIEKSGAEGQTWAEAYRRSGVNEMIRSTQDALLLLRAGRLDEAAVILNRTAMVCAINSDRKTSSSLEIFWRYYEPAMAYFHYCSGDLEAAWKALNNAEQAIRTIVSTRSYLVAMAESCLDFTIQKARVARALRDWNLMWACLWKARDMAGNRVPLCTTDNGELIYFSTISDEISSFELSDEESRAWHEVVNDNVRQSIVERLIREVYTLPGLVIDY